MAIERKEYDLTNTDTVISSELISVKILRLRRAGTGYNMSTTGPGNREFVHDDALGSVEFNTSSIGTEKIIAIINAP